MGPCRAPIPSMSSAHSSSHSGSRARAASPRGAWLGVSHHRASPQPSSARPSLSALLLELGPQAIYINMFVTDMKIETFFGLIKMFKLELACCLWISPFC